MDKEKYSFSNKGFTLVEIIIAIAVMGVVSMIALKLFSFSNTTLNKTEDRSFNQMSVRNASTAITDRVRYAKELQLVKDVDIPSGKTDPSITGDGYDYIYFDKTDKTLTIIYEDDTSIKQQMKFITSKLNTDIEKTYFLLESEPSSATPVRDMEQIVFEITGKGDKYQDDNDDYKIKTTVNLINSNTPEFAPKPNIVGGSLDRNVKYRAIRYK